MTTKYQDFQWMWESFTSDLFGEQVDTQPLLDAKQEELQNLWLAVMWKVGEMHKEQVKRDIDRILKLSK